MSILKKSQIVTVKLGTAGTDAIPAIPARAGYYREIQVAHTGVPSASDNVTSYVPAVSGVPDIVVRPATYLEIISYLWPGKLSDLCGIRAYILETINNTEFQYKPLRSIDLKNMFTVAYCLELGSTGICKATRADTKVPWPLALRNSAYDYMHTALTADPIWKFSDYYTCSVVNGSERVVAKS